MMTGAQRLKREADWSATVTVAMSAKRENGVCVPFKLNLREGFYAAEKRGVCKRGRLRSSRLV